MERRAFLLDPIIEQHERFEDAGPPLVGREPAFEGPLREIDGGDILSWLKGKSHGILLESISVGCRRASAKTHRRVEPGASSRTRRHPTPRKRPAPATDPRSTCSSRVLEARPLSHK